MMKWVSGTCPYDPLGPPTLERSGSEHRRAVTSLSLLDTYGSKLFN